MRSVEILQKQAVNEGLKALRLGLLLPTGAEGCFIEGERERKRVREAR